MSMSTFSAARLALALVSALPLAACHARAAASPLVSSVSPDTVQIGNGAMPLLTVRGHGFGERNIVHFGALRIPDVPRSSDSVMQFAVPIDDTFLPDRGAVPVTPLGAGRYDLRIANERGTSNAVTVTLVSRGGAR